MKNWREELTADENLMSNFPGKCGMIIIICNNDDATQPHT